MKKIIFLFALLLSVNCFAKDYSALCSTVKPDKNFSGTLSSLSGINFTTKKIVQSQIEKALKKETNSKFDVEIENFFGVSLLSGNFGKVSAKSSNLVYDGFYFSNFTAETICPYNSVSFDDDNVKFNENMVLKYVSEISQDDIEKTINSTEYKKFIDKINSDNVLSALINIKEPVIKIMEDDILFEYEIVPLPNVGLNQFANNFVKPIKVSMNANLSVVDGKIQLSDFKFNDSKFDKYKGLLNLMNSYDILSFNVNPTKDTKGKMEIDNIKVENSKIKITGYLVIPKD